MLCRICDALSHSDEVTSFQGVVQHNQAWPYLSQLRLFGWFSVRETEAGLSALSNRPHILQAMRMSYVKLISGSACDLKMAARYVRHRNEPAFGSCLAPFPIQPLLHAQTIHTVVRETMPGAVSA